MTGIACEELKGYTYEKYRCDFWEWLCKRGGNEFKSRYKKVWEGTNTNATYLFDLAAQAAGYAAIRGLSLAPAREFFGIEKNVSFPMACHMLKEADLYGIAEKGAGCLSDPAPKNFYDKHHSWCKKVQEAAADLGIKTVPKYKNDRYWSDGRSAKLINVFLKALMICKHENLPDEKGEEKEKWYAVHPPIDEGVLKGMKDAGIGDQDFWNSLPGSAPHGAWTKFRYEHYQNVIDTIRDNLKRCGYKDPLPLWKNERFFKSVVHPECR